MSADQWFPYVVRGRLFDAPAQLGIIVAAFVNAADARRYVDECNERQQTLVYWIERVAA